MGWLLVSVVAEFFILPTESIPQISMFSAKKSVHKIFIDGACRGNPGPAGIGVYIEDFGGVEEGVFKKYIGQGTNNIAEYCALIAGLELASQYKPATLHCFLDSELVVNQLNGIYRVKNDRIKVLYQEVKSQEAHFTTISYSYLPRTHEKMKMVDRLVNQALDEEERKESGI